MTAVSHLCAVKTSYFSWQGWTSPSVIVATKSGIFIQSLTWASARCCDKTEIQFNIKNLKVWTWFDLSHRLFFGLMSVCSRQPAGEETELKWPDTIFIQFLSNMNVLSHTQVTSQSILGKTGKARTHQSIWTNLAKSELLVRMELIMIQILKHQL